MVGAFAEPALSDVSLLIVYGSIAVGSTRLDCKMKVGRMLLAERGTTGRCSLWTRLCCQHSIGVVRFRGFCCC